MDAKHHSIDHLLMELLIENGPEAMLAIFTAVYNMGMMADRSGTPAFTDIKVHNQLMN